MSVEEAEFAYRPFIPGETVPERNDKPFMGGNDPRIAALQEMKERQLLLLKRKKNSGGQMTLDTYATGVSLLPLSPIRVKNSHCARYIKRHMLNDCVCLNLHIYL